jgi:hypothetical protein
MEADAHRRGSMAGHEPVRDLKPEQDCLARVRDAQHDCVADCLHMSGASR